MTSLAAGRRDDVSRCLLTVLLACTVGAVVVLSESSVSDFVMGGHRFSVETDPSFQLSVDGKPVNLSTEAASQVNGTGYVRYSNFTDLPGLTVQLYDNGGYSVSFRRGFLVVGGNLTEEQQRQLDEALNQTKLQIEKEMKALDDMFNQPHWPFV